MTYGTGSAADAWPRKTETILGQPWQFLNFAHYGYDVAQSLATLRHHVWPYAPELIVYAAYFNDAARSRYVTAGDPPLPTSIGARDELIPVSLRARSGLLRTFEGAWLARRVTDTSDLAFFADGVRALRDEAAAHGTPLLVVTLVPHVAAGSAHCDDRCARALAATRDLGATIDALGVPHGSVLPALRASGHDAFYPDNPEDWEHPSPEGHAVVAAAVADIVRRFRAGTSLPRLDDPPPAR